MKILHVCQLYSPSIGGNQLHIQVLSEKLVQSGVQVHVFTANALTPAQFTHDDPSFTPLPPQENVNGVHVRRFAVNYRLRQFLFRTLYNIRGGYRAVHAVLGSSFEHWDVGPLTVQMLWAIRKLKPDLIVAVINYSFTTYVCYLAKKLFGFKLAIMPITHLSNPKTFNPFLRTMYAKADLLIACTDFEKDHLVAQGVPSAKIAVWPLGIDIASLNGQDGDRFRKKYNIGTAPLVAYIGRKVTNKGIETLMEAMPMVWKDLPEAKLLLAGETRSDMAPIIQRHMESFSLEQRQKVILVEYFSDEEKKDIFAAIDVLAMVSQIDAFGIAYLEAWLSGKPVIACKAAAQASIINDGINGFLIPYGNVGEMAQALKRLLTDKMLCESMGNAGCNKVRSIYNLDVYAHTVAQGYRRLIKGEGK